MAVSKGLGSFKGSGDGTPMFRIADNETKHLRFLDDGPDIMMAYVHYVWLPEYKGFALCLGGRDTCPLCRVGRREMKSPISLANKVIFARVIERGNPDTVKLYKGTSTVATKLGTDYEANGTITDVDYSLKRTKESRGKGQVMTTYSIDALRNTSHPLNDAEIAMKSVIDLEVFMKDLTRNPEEMAVWAKSVGGDSDSPTVPPVESSPKVIKEEEDQLPF